MTSAAILDSVLRGNTGNMSKDKEKRAVWTKQQEDVLMDIFEDNEGLYKTGEKAYSNRESNTHFFLFVLSAKDAETHIKTLRDLYMRKTKAENKSWSGLEHLLPWTRPVVLRLQFLEPWRRVTRATHSTLPLPSAAAALAETSRAVDEGDDDDSNAESSEVYICLLIV